MADFAARNAYVLPTVVGLCTICGVVAPYFVFKRQAPPDGEEFGKSVDEVVELRYQALLSPLHLWIHVVGFATVIVALLSIDSGINNVHLAGVVLVVFASFSVMFWLSSKVAASQRAFILRSLLIMGTVSFRLLRIFDILWSSDRTAFVVGTADMLAARFYTATTWSCLAQGWFVGVLMPSCTMAWRVLFLLTVSFSGAIPPLIGYMLTGHASWLAVVVTVVLLPNLAGLLLELVQRHFIKRLLVRTVRAELALALPVPDAQHNATRALSDFEPVGVLGFGGSAMVRLMRSRHADSDLRAVKSIFKTRHGRALDEKNVGRAREEVAILRAAHSHPFIITLHDAFEDEFCIHCVLEYASNGPLSQWLMTDPLEMEAARGVAAEITAAVGHLHSLGIVYRDLKPENVLVSTNGHILLADFGVSKRLRRCSAEAGGDEDAGSSDGKGCSSAVATGGGSSDARSDGKQGWRGAADPERSEGIGQVDDGSATRSLPPAAQADLPSETPPRPRRTTEAKSLVGTPGYMAPEVLLSAARSGHESDAAVHSYPVDWWALGVMLHTMLTLEEPFGNKTVIDLLADRGGSASGHIASCINASISPLARDLIQLLLCIDPGERLGGAGVRSHPFFEATDWEQLVQLRLPPPLPGLGLCRPHRVLHQGHSKAE